MNVAFLVAGAVAVATGLAHSYLGERMILVPLFRRNELPASRFGNEAVTKLLLRAVWHFATVWWLSVAAMLFALSGATLDGPAQTAVIILAVPFAVMALVALLGLRGRHPAWLAFTVMAVAMFWGAL